jgi:chorismate mutase-like protein
MTDASANLDDLRREIDDLDARIHDLLMRRAEVVERIARAKAGAGLGGALMRPGREAQVLRRLLARHKGSLPPAVIVALWRELMSAFLRLQGPLEVAVWPGAEQSDGATLGFWDLARAHFGATTPMTLHESAAQALRAVSERPGAVAVLPEPGDEEADPWWPYLVSRAPGAPRIVARLPFARLDDGSARQPSAVVVASFEAEATGDDFAYLGLAVTGEASRARIASWLTQAGFEGRILVSVAGAGGPIHLAEVAGHVPAADPRLDALVAASEGLVDRVVVVGGFAAPLALGAAPGLVAARA